MFNSRKPTIKLPVYKNHSKKYLKHRQKLYLKIAVISIFILFIVIRWRSKSSSSDIVDDQNSRVRKLKGNPLEVHLLPPVSSDAKNFKELTIAREAKLVPAGNSIPKIVHFIYGLRDPAPQLDLIHYLAIKSAHERIKPDKIMFHYHHLPVGKYFQKARSMLTLNKVDLVNSVFDRPVDHYAHRADVLRLQVLEQYGGIYLDLDLVSLNSIDHLLDREFVMGQEGIDGSVGLCNAMIMSRPHSRFIQRWYATYSTFDNSLWNYHSVILPGKLAPFFPKEVTVLNHTSFFWPLWDSDGLRSMYLEKSYDFSGNLGVHVWESAANKNLMKSITEEVILEIDNSLYCQLRPFVLDGKMDPRPNSCQILSHSERLDQLVGHWPLQKPKRVKKALDPLPAEDDSGNNLSGLIRNGRFIDRGVYLPGDGSYIFLGMPIETEATSFTVSWWMKTSTQNSGEMVMVIQTNIGRIRVKTLVNSEDELSLELDVIELDANWEWVQVEGAGIRSSPYILDDEYHHYTLVIDKKENALLRNEPPIVFYIDGHVTSSNINWVFPQKIGTNIRGIWFGSIEPLNGRYQNAWNNTLDLEAHFSDISIWERGLSVNETIEVYESSKLKSLIASKKKERNKPKKVDNLVEDDIPINYFDSEIENEDEDEELLLDGVYDQLDD